MSVDVYYVSEGWKVVDLEHENSGENIMETTRYTDTWLDAEVPGDIHNDLFKADRINDPYYADNSKEIGWVTEKDWVYKKTFRLPENFLKDKTKVVFEGIDTFSSIWFNGQKIGETNNMFREYSFDVTEVIKEKEDNELIVRVKSIKHMMEKFPYQKYFACFNTPRVFIRKAQCHFGWDWAPDLPAMGIWQHVKVVTAVEGHIENVQIKTKIDGKIMIFIKVDRKPTINDLAQSKEKEKIEKIEDELLVQISDGKTSYSKRIGVRGGKNHLTLEIENPILWWPNGYGEPFLYSYSIKLFRRNVEIDEKEGLFGIREVELKQEPLKEGGFGFQFNINKVPVYCKGANWIPLDCFTGTIKDEKYENMIKLAQNANFNILRIWGGGIYEKDIFYKLCDENGIMVWQDFMFACSDVPDDHSWFIDCVIPEIEYQVKRLRNHPSIVYWCGGNEKTGSAGLKVSYGEEMFHYIIRGICSDLDDTRQYGVASPSSFSDLGNDQDSGDTHCNCLEHSFKRGMTVFREEIEKIKAVFNSECAIQGPARYQSMSRFLPEKKLWPLNDLWRFRYKDNPYNSLVEEYLDVQEKSADILFGKCSCVKDFLKKAMTVHAEILRAEIEHQRCRKWVNNGFMFWMYGDIWPTGTWAVVDYYGLPKPAYYAVMRAYEPLVVSIQQLNEEIEIFVSNDTLNNVNGILEYGQATVDGKVIWKKETGAFYIYENESKEIVRIGGLIENATNSYIFARFTGEGVKAQTTFFHNLWKDIEWQEPGLEYEIVSKEVIEENFIRTIKITAEKYARMVNINLPDNSPAIFSDNFFDMEAGETKLVTITSEDDFDLEGIHIDHWLTEWI